MKQIGSYPWSLATCFPVSFLFSSSLVNNSLKAFFISDSSKDLAAALSKTLCTLDMKSLHGQHPFFFEESPTRTLHC